MGSNFFCSLKLTHADHLLNLSFFSTGGQGGRGGHGIRCYHHRVCLYTACTGHCYKGGTLPRAARGPPGDKGPDGPG